LVVQIMYFSLTVAIDDLWPFLVLLVHKGQYIHLHLAFSSLMKDLILKLQEALYFCLLKVRFKLVLDLGVIFSLVQETQAQLVLLSKHSQLVEAALEFSKLLLLGESLIFRRSVL